MTHAIVVDRFGPLPAPLGQPVTAPVMRVKTPTGDDIWLVTGYELGRLVLTDPRLSRAAATCPRAPKVNTVYPAASSIMSMDGADHARLRRLVAAEFAPRRVAEFAPGIQSQVDHLLDELCAGDQPADLIAAFAAPLPIAVISTLLGIPAADLDRVRTWAGVLFEVTASTPQDKARRGFALFQYMSQLIERKREEPADDLLCRLIAAHDAGAVSRTELIDLALAVLTAGYETTVGQVGLSVLSVLLDPAPPEHRRQAWTAPDAPEEYLRLVPATPTTFPRVAVEDVDLGGVTVRAGEAVVVSLLHANLDPTVFPDPDRLVPNRIPNPHLTFGHGAHFCLGAGLARLQISIAVRTLLLRLPNLRLAEDPAAVAWAEGLATRGLSQLLVEW
jgi:cytochrome P450